MRLLPVRITPSAWGKPALYPVVFEGEEFLVRKYMPDRAVLREVWEKRCYPAPQDGDIVMDIGANIGAYAVFASRAAKHVYAFEPEASNFEQLSQNIRHKKNITALRLAVAGSAGTRMLGTPRMSRNRSSLYDQSKGQEVHCVTLREAIGRTGASVIDLAKVDIEGAEYETLLHTTPEILRRCRSIFLEFHDGWTSHTYPELTAHLTQAGFSVRLRRGLQYWTQGTGYIEATRN
jgi:FkbM family methyltransferase